tara:strand:- start:310 stop:534 length:225 start_codon:yes stop_codon:yes gene_type:complete
MKWILYVALTVFLENGEPAQHEFKLTFEEAKHCTEMKKVFNVGVSFWRLAHDSKLVYKAECKKVISTKTIKRSL